MSAALDLNPEQKRAFNRMKKAYEDCLKLKVMFVNNYGTLEAYDKKYVKNYTDGDLMDGMDESVKLSTHTHWASNSMSTEVSWADDEHFIHLTKAGAKIHYEGD